ncbi:AAA family ATPase [Domibacillus sp. A3M-37]|uniref:AAA family ATPase n=1 Tax=Domibacillus sp. A3M-37 TaxID=2962037 RepID=UPI0020B8510B|nr:AAA family ATPase [Domibacillus sp. A3M-37]MCP3763642.1 AAA family ATPase [Domibacillus sp. A3M-37]
MILVNQHACVEYSINEINALLKSYGFTNFELAASSEKGNYGIVCSNGENAKETLSEGEKTFITFLYFSQLIKGSNNKESLRRDKVIVLDDSISSLDSNILFIVSNLIRKLVDSIRSSNCDIKQLFILTHNIYLHKEVSFNKGKGATKLKDETFWIIRKIDNKSYVESYNENPIKTSYELLWKELLAAKQDESVITIQNIMRRIIGNYFKFFRNIDIDKQIDAFPEEDRTVCHSMMSWINDGSHYINEDLYVEAPAEVSTRYFKVFEKIFEKSGHHAHYKMMIGEEIDSSELTVL